MIDMELDDELKLRVAIKLIDKSAIVWLDILKFRSNTLMTWNYFVWEFIEQYYSHFHRDSNSRNFSDSSNLGEQIICTFVFRGCEVLIEGIILKQI